MMSLNVNGICILQVILLCAWVTLVDTFVSVSMDFMGFMEGMTYVRGIWKEECY